MQKKSGFWSEFRNFAVKGNAFDLAVAVVIGNAFSAVVNSLVGDFITPLIGVLTNHVDLKNLAWAPYGVVFKYGDLIQAVINFFLIALSIFVVFKIIATTRKRLFERHEEDAVPEHEKPEDVRLLEEIRDILKGDAKEPGV
jgi:large conductance mechanosensitive channel